MMRRSALILVCLLMTTPAFAAVVVVQNLGVHDDVAGNQVFTKTVTGTNALVVGIFVNSGTGTITGCSGSINGALTQTAADGTYDWIFSKRNITGGAETITCTSSDGASTAYTSTGYELSGLDNAATPQTDLESNTDTSHACYSPGITGTGFFFAVSTFGSTSDVTLGSGYTSDMNLTGAAGMSEYVIKAGSSETTPFVTSTSLFQQCAAAFFSEAAGGGGGGGGHHVLTLGAG